MGSTRIIHGFIEFKDYLINEDKEKIEFFSYGKVVEVVNYPNKNTIEKYIIERVLDIRGFLTGQNKATELLEFSVNNVPNVLVLHHLM